MIEILNETICWIVYTIVNFGWTLLKAIIQTIIGLKPLTKIISITYGQIILAGFGITGVAATISLLLIGLISPKAKKTLDKGPF